MTERVHYSEYDDSTTRRCERVLLTLLGDVGPWRERIYLAGGLAPAYLVGDLPVGTRPHIGTADVDLVLSMAVSDDSEEAYRTLQGNLLRAGFEIREPSYRWARVVDGATVLVEFLCETDKVGPGRICRPKGPAGSRLGAFNVRGAELVRLDFVEREIEGERLDGGGRSRVTARVAGLAAYTVLKIFAFQDRHQNKDAYDLVFTILNYPEGPSAAGRAIAASAIAGEPRVTEALRLLEERFEDHEQDGPMAYARFLSEPGDEAQGARLRREAVATIREVLRGIRESA